MYLDRAYQLELLRGMAEVYPFGMDISEMGHQWGAGGEYKYAANMMYLEEHGLAESRIQIGIDTSLGFGFPTITAKGLDFLEDDGGLSAILGVVTIKIHDDTIRQLLADRINELDGSAEEKGKLRNALEKLSQTGAQALVNDLVQHGVANLPNSIHALQAWLQPFIR